MYCVGSKQDVTAGTDFAFSGYGLQRLGAEGGGRAILRPGLFYLLGEPSKRQFDHWVLVCAGDPADAPFPLPDLDVSFPRILLCFSQCGFVVGRLDLPDADKTNIPPYDNTHDYRQIVVMRFCDQQKTAGKSQRVT